jgi:hypothetical protein
MNHDHVSPRKICLLSLQLQSGVSCSTIQVAENITQLYPV